MTIYLYDTEFLEDGSTVDLISIGIVADDGREYYAVSTEFDTERVLKHPWLMANVMSSIDHELVYPGDPDNLPREPCCANDRPIGFVVTDDARKSRLQMRTEIFSFLTGGATPPQLWAWFGAYDHVALSQLWGRMLDLPAPLPMWTNDLKTIETLFGFQFPQQPDGNHNALEDARFNMTRWKLFQEAIKINGA